MTSTSQRQRVRRMSPRDAATVVNLLEHDFQDVLPRAGVSEGVVAHQMLLDALDRRLYERFLLWPGDDPVAVLFNGSGGTLMPAGNPSGGAPLAEATESLGWRVLVGDAPLGWALLDGAGGAGGRGLFRRRVSAREQRLMAVRAEEVASIDRLAPARPDPDGLRPASLDDLETLVEQACRLHVEDKMGTPIARGARGGVRQRLRESIALRQTWVVEQRGRAVAKADLSLSSPRRGAQIAGVYVDLDARGQGVGGGLVAALVRMLLREGAPVVSLHVRADNAPAIAAYRSAGLVDRRAWILALR